MNSTLLAFFDVSQIMPIYCRLMDVDIPAKIDVLPTALKAKMMAPELIWAWNPQKVLTEIETFSSAVDEQECLDDELLGISINAFQEFTQAMKNTGPPRYMGLGPDSYGDGEERWHFTVVNMKIGRIALQLCPRVPNATVASRAKNLRDIEKYFEKMMLALEDAPYVFSSSLGEHTEKDRKVWTTTATAIADFLEVVRKVNAQHSS